MRILICITLLIVCLLHIHFAYGNKYSKNKMYDLDGEKLDKNKIESMAKSEKSNENKSRQILKKKQSSENDDNDSVEIKCTGKKCWQTEEKSQKKNLNKNTDAETEALKQKSKQKNLHSESESKDNKVNKNKQSRKTLKEELIAKNYNSDEDNSNDNDNDSKESSEEVCFEKNAKNKRLKNCNEEKDSYNVSGNENEDSDETNEDDDERPVLKRKQVIYIKKFAHEKNAKKRKPNGDESILKIHRGSVEKNYGKNKFRRINDDDDEDSDEDHNMPKRLYLVHDEDDD